MSVQCVSIGCRETIDPSWDFCPHCGTDNRPPNQRRQIPAHVHNWIGPSSCCTLCGEEEGEPYGFSSRKRRWVGRALFFSGLLVQLWVVNMLFARWKLPALLAVWINSWWDKRSIFRVRLPFMSTHLIGPTVCFWFTVIAVILMIAGIFILKKRRVAGLGDILDFD